MIIQLAWRNLWRQPRRTILSSLAIAFTAAFLIFMPSLQNGSYNTMIETTLRLYDGYAEIQQEGYRDNPQIRNSIQNYAAVLAELAIHPEVNASGARAIGSAILSSESRSLGAQIVGVQPSVETKISSIPGNIRNGRFLQGDDSDEIVMGITLARNLQLNLGDKVTLLGMGRDGSLAVDSLVLVGTFDTGIHALDRLMAEVPLNRFQQAFTMEGQAHAIVLSGETISQFQPILKSIQRIAQQHKLKLLDWKALQPGLYQGILLDISSAAMIYIAMVLVVTFSLLNSLLMSVLERTREFGVLLALGMRPGFIGRMVWTETILIIVIGLSVGLLIGYVVSEYYGNVGIHFEQAQEIFDKYGLPSAIYPEVNALTLLAGPIVIGVSVLLAGLFPVLRIYRLEPVPAMRTI